MSKESQECLSVRVGRFTLPSGNLTGLMKARGGITGTLVNLPVQFTQINIAFHPIRVA